MHVNRPFRHLAPFLAAACLAAFLCPGDAKKPPKPPPAPKFDREQFMLMNLNRGADSTGYYIVESLRQAKLMVKNLDKAARQLEQVDATYAKSRGRPDDRFLASAGDRIKQAQQTAAQLEMQLRACYDDLKTSIHQTLVLESIR